MASNASAALKHTLLCLSSIRKALENRTNMEDDRITLLENQLGQARLIAEESDKKYEEMARRIALLEADLERAEERASTGER